MRFFFIPLIMICRHYFTEFVVSSRLGKMICFHCMRRPWAICSETHWVRPMETTIGHLEWWWNDARSRDVWTEMQHNLNEHSQAPALYIYTYCTTNLLTDAISSLYDVLGGNRVGEIVWGIIYVGCGWRTEPRPGQKTFRNFDQTSLCSL
jgi:hypothetical protein